MTTITVKNIPDDVYKQLKRLAEINRRSINSEIIVCIERAVKSYVYDPETLLAEARQLRERTAHYRITDEEIDQAKKAGRL